MILSQCEDSADTWCSLPALPWMCSGTHSHSHEHASAHTLTHKYTEKMLSNAEKCSVYFKGISDQTPTFSDHPSEVSSLHSWTQLQKGVLSDELKERDTSSELYSN